MADVRRTGRNTETLSSQDRTGTVDEPIQPPSGASSLQDSVDIEGSNAHKPRLLSQVIFNESSWSGKE